jgi:hypothetical protein
VATQSEFRKLAREFAAISKENKTALRRGMRKIATPTLHKVRTAAGWSSRIPSSTKLSAGLNKRFTGIRIETDRRKSPHALPYENYGRVGHYRHPVYGRSKVDRKLWTWVRAPARPYAYPTVVEDLPEIGERMLDTLIDLCIENGFHSS